MSGWLQPIVNLYAFILGAVVGSFLNVVIYRVPRGLSIVSPRSRCPSCERPIRWYENLPLVSWIALRARCRGCGCRISLRYPLVEGIAGLMAVAGILRFGMTPLAAEVVLFAWISLALGLIDLEHQMLPDVMTYPSIVLGLAFSWWGGWVGLPWSVAGAILGAALPTAVIFLYRALRGEDGMGWGDVKYLAAIGAVVGARDCVRVLVVSSVVGALVGLGLMAAGRGTTKTALPFGTFLALAVVVWLYAPDAWRALLPL
jgi:leader peptidase (prepilin peptidase)/N-methyltransferase